MASMPKKVAERLSAAIKRFQPIIASAQARDLNESDTVTVVTDMLADVFGYDKYPEVTSEHAIRGTYCDLAIRLDGTLQLHIEVKAVDASPSKPRPPSSSSTSCLARYRPNRMPVILSPRLRKFQRMSNRRLWLIPASALCANNESTAAASSAANREVVAETGMKPILLLLLLPRLGDPMEVDCMSA